MPDKLARALVQKFTAFRDRESQLVEELIRYKFVLDVCPCPMALAAPDGKVIYVNQSYCSMVHASLEDIVDTGWRNLIVPEDVERVAALWDRVVTERIEAFDEWATFKSLGRLFWRSRRLTDGSYAIAVFHPACAFFTHDRGTCVFQWTQI